MGKSHQRSNTFHEVPARFQGRYVIAAPKLDRFVIGVKLTYMDCINLFFLWVTLRPKRYHLSVHFSQKI